MMNTPTSTLTLRAFAGPEDYARMAEIENACNAADGLDFLESAEDIRHRMERSAALDPARDMLLAEQGGQALGFARLTCADEVSGLRRYNIAVNVHPLIRRHGLGRQLLHWAQARARAIEDGKTPAQKTVYHAWALEAQQGGCVLLEHEGYGVARLGHEMRRSLHDPISDFALAPGFEFRATQPEHYQAVHAADIDAFRDHNGFVEPDATEYARWLQGAHFSPQLWQVIWHIESNRIAAQVLNYINHEENEKFKRKLGMTEDISTQRDFRKLGLARAAISRSLRMFQALGYDTVALGVDAANPTGAMRVYQDCGYTVTQTERVCQKLMETSQ